MNEQLPKEELVKRAADSPGGATVEILSSDLDQLLLQISCLREDLKHEQRRTFQSGRICYRGFSYGVEGEWGRDSLRNAIRRDGND